MKRILIVLILSVLANIIWGQTTQKDTVNVKPFEDLTLVTDGTVDTSDQLLIYDISSGTFAFRGSLGELLKKIADVQNIISTSNIVNATIEDEDISGSAGIGLNKLATSGTGNILVTDSGGSGVWEAGTPGYGLDASGTTILVDTTNEIASKEYVDNALAFAVWNGSTLRIDTINQFVAVTENSQQYYSLGGNIEMRADSGNITLNGGATGEIRLQGDSLDAQINYVSDYDDGINTTIVENTNGELRATTRLLPKWDTLIVTTANDTIDIGRHFDQVAFLDMTSAPATVTIVAQNPANMGWLHMMFLNVGGTHTINFSHSTADADAASSFEVSTTSNLNAWVFRYLFGSWIANYMSP